MASLLLNKGNFTKVSHVRPVLMFNQNLLCFSYEWLSLPIDEINRFFLLSLLFRLYLLPRTDQFLRFSQFCAKFTKITEILSSFSSQNIDKGLSKHYTTSFER